MPVNDTVLLTVQGTVGGQNHVHTLHFRQGFAIDNDQTLIDAWQASCRTAYRGLFDVMDGPCQLYRASQVCGAVPLRAPTEEPEVAPNIVGARDPVTDPAPTWLAAVVSERTALAGRSRRGRFFIGGLYESDINGNNLVSGYVLLVQAYIDALMGAFGAGGTAAADWRLVVHSGTLAAVPGTECQDSSTPVNGMIARTAIGTMKSRKPGSGT